VNTDILGSLEFACNVAGSRLIVVLGHTGCGAIKGACDHVEMGNLTELLSKIHPAVYAEKTTVDSAQRTGSNPEFVYNVTALNVRRTVQSIVNRSFILEQMIEKGEVAINGGIHHLDNGEVVFLEDTWIGNAEEAQASMNKG
jgi:carbonic anhydrase